MTAQNKVKDINSALAPLRTSRSTAFGVIIITALLAFEIFNYTTTDYALTDLLGDLTFMGVRWATILAIAFCGIDFAGIARLFAPDMSNTHYENWFLFGAWLLAATMNATLTWWGVSLAILNHGTAGDAVIARETMLRAAPIFVALLVWLIRVLIIGTFSVAGERMIGGERPEAAPIYRPVSRPAQAQRVPTNQPTRPQVQATQSPAQRAAAGRPAGTHSFGTPPRRFTPSASNDYLGGADEETEVEMIEPTYNTVPLAARSSNRPTNNPPASGPGNNSSRNTPPRRF